MELLIITTGGTYIYHWAPNSYTCYCMLFKQQWRSMTCSKALTIFQCKGYESLATEYIHRTSSSMVHNHKSQHGAHVQQRLQNKCVAAP
jgi:hypothetical protein